MGSRELGRRPLASVHRGRRIFNRRKSSRSRPFLVAGTVAVGLALVFTIGFKLGRTYQTESVAVADHPVAAIEHPVAVAPGTVARIESLNRE